MSIEDAVRNGQHRLANSLLQSGGEQWRHASSLYKLAPTAEMVRVLCQAQVPITSDVITRVLREVAEHRSADVVCTRTLPTVLELLDVAVNNDVPIDVSTLDKLVPVTELSLTADLKERLADALLPLSNASQAAYELIYLISIVNHLRLRRVDGIDRYQHVPIDMSFVAHAIIESTLPPDQVERDYIMRHDPWSVIANNPLHTPRMPRNAETLIYLGVYDRLYGPVMADMISETLPYLLDPVVAQRLYNDHSTVVRQVPTGDSEFAQVLLDLMEQE